ncbi:MAG: permease [Elusimicrobia bacterium]|nr:permease [Elusimicrobiota bacterium]
MFLSFSNWLVFGLFGLDEGSRWAAALHFFIYDSLKITVLLAGVIFAISVLRSFVPRMWLERSLQDRSLGAHVVAALFGAVTPFCSCSSIPLFIGLVRAGAPLGVMFSFLITSPIINEYLLVLMVAYFGWKIAVAYFVSGLLIGIIGGRVLGRMRLEGYLEEGVGQMSLAEALPESAFPTLMSRLRFGWREAFAILKRIWLWILFAVGLGAVIHNYVPREMIETLIASTGILSVPLAVLLGVPMYGSCAAIVPIAVVLFQKGVPLGTALAFMMAVSALSLPEAVLLRRVMRFKLILLFFGVTTIAIVVTGYLFNALQHVLI